MDLAERLEALRERNDAPVPDETPIYTDAEAKDVFLSALEEGATIPEASKRAGRTATWFRARRKPGARVYDVDFSLAFDEIMAPDGPNREGLTLRIFTALVRAAEEGNVRAQEKILAAYHTDFHFLRPVPLQGDTYNVEKLVQILPGVSTETLMAMREELLAQRELPEVIDG